MKAILAVIIAVLIIGGGAFALARKGNKKIETTNTPTTQTETSNNTNQSNSTNNATNQNNTSSDSTITYSDSGFSPSTLTVKSGTTVTIKNTSSHTMQFDSDPHPAHTANPELNVNTVKAGESMTFTANRMGSFGYHNHLNPSETGTLIVN